MSRQTELILIYVKYEVPTGPIHVISPGPVPTSLEPRPSTTEAKLSLANSAKHGSAEAMLLQRRSVASFDCVEDGHKRAEPRLYAVITEVECVKSPKAPCVCLRHSI